MRFLPPRVEGRREFFRAIARYTVFGAVTAICGIAAKKQLQSGQTCINRGICSGCGQFERCILPQALSAKHEKGQV
jgi:hypothetical protein